MTIEDKIENFRALLNNSYTAQQKENLIISREILTGNDFDLRELNEIICPRLVKEGILRRQPSFLINPDNIEEKIDVGAFEKIRDIENRIRAISKTRTNDKIHEEINQDAINGLEEQKQSYITRIPSYEFVVNKNNLTKRKHVSATVDDPLWNIPADTRWEDITIKFQDGEKVEILVRNKHLANATYKEFRLGKNKPNKQWRLLHLLATIYAAQEQFAKSQSIPATIDDLANSLLGRVNQEAKINIHTVKKNLSSQLAQNFGIAYDDPFEDYNQWGYYKAKFNVVPEPELRRENVYEVGGRLNENRVSTFDEEDDDFKDYKDLT